MRHIKRIDEWEDGEMNYALMGVMKRANTQDPVAKFLSAWTEGSTSAASLFTDVVKDRLDVFRQTTKITENITRGFKFKDQRALEQTFGLMGAEEGQRTILRMKTMSSWTKSPAMAKKFANPKYDSINKKMYTAADIFDMGYKKGDKLGIGVVVEMVNPNPEKVAFDTTYLVDDYGKYLEHQNEEHEVVMLPGDYKVKIISVKDYTL